jgi:16S rRNA (uracil1498-N3)-methyltransferase
VTGPGPFGFRPRFFVPEVEAEDLPPGTALSLTAEDSHHALHVLRLVAGDACEVVAGAAVYAASVSAVGEVLTVRLQALLEGAEAGASYRVRVGLVQSLARPAALDTALEKGTEVGCSFFLLVRSAGSPKWAESWREDRLVRWKRVVREAAKQSKQVVVPSVVPLASIDDALSHLRDTGTRSLILEPGAPITLYDSLAELGAADASPRPVALWVGPEGGWTESEFQAFKRAGIVAARLGRSVLRTETAGPVAIAVARLALGDW